MASSVNNTVGLGNGVPSGRSSNSNVASMITAKQLSGYTAEAVSSAIARENYQTLSMSDSKVSELRRYVYKMVSTWSMNHKNSILVQYGDINLLGPNANETDINKQVTETLIINMKQEDLEILLKDIKTDEREVAKEVQNIRTERKRNGKKARSFGVNAFQMVAKRTEDARSPREIRKFLKAYDKSFRVPKKITKQYGKLKKELQQVLKDLFNVVELSGLAYEMEIEVPDKVKYKDLTNMIINKTLLYISLITGKSKTMYGGAIVRSEPFHRILKYTSYAFVTGEAGMSPEQIKKLREDAARAKAQIKEGFRRKEKGLKQRGIIGRAVNKVASAPTRAAKSVVGGILGGVTGVFSKDGIVEGAKKGASKARQFGLTEEKRLVNRGKEFYHLSKTGDLTKEQQETKDQLTELAQKDPQLLFQKANLYGLQPRMNKALLVDEIMAKVLETELALKRVENKEKRKNFFGKQLSLADQGRKKALQESLSFAETKDLASPSEGPNVPYYYHETGKTVPVYVANQITSIGMISMKDAETISAGSDEAVMPVYVANKLLEMVKLTEAPNISTDDLVMPVFVVNQISGAGSGGEGILSRLDKTPEDQIRNNPDLQRMGELIKSLNDPAPMLSSEERADISKFGLDLSRNTDTDRYEYDEASGPFTGLSEKDPFVAKVDNTLQATAIKGAMAIRVFDQGAIIAQQMAEKVEKRKNSRLKNSSSKDYLSDEATSFGIRMVKKEPASPVYVVNKMQDVTTRTDLKMGKLEELAMKAAKLAINAALPGIGPIVTSVLGLATGGKGRASRSSATPRFATGTTSKGSSSMSTAASMSQFIAGDSLNGKPNEEQVSIDWSKKEFQVKPVPSIDRQSLANSGISQAAKMGQLEKKSPMAVGITTQLATYTRDLKYAKDQGTKEAIKVMPVTPGIDDLVEFDGQQVSLIGLVAQMNSQLAVIQNLLQTGNQQRNAVVANTGSIDQKTSSSSGSSNPFLEGGFPKSLDSILQGQ